MAQIVSSLETASVDRTQKHNGALFSGILPYVSLLKLRIVGLLVFVSLAAALVASGGTLEAGSAVLLIITGSMAAAGAGALNHYAERDLDRNMDRTSQRPLVSGRIGEPESGLALGLGLVFVSAALALPFNLWLAIFNSAGAFVYVVVYTIWLKRRSSWNIIIGGAAGSFAVLSGWASAGSWWTLEAALMALLVFLWTPPHFWSLTIMHLDDYTNAGVPMLPVVAGAKPAALWGLFHVLLLSIVSIALAVVGPFTGIYFGVAFIAALTMSITGILLAMRPFDDAARLHFRASIFYVVVVFAAMILDILVKSQLIRS